MLARHLEGRDQLLPGDRHRRSTRIAVGAAASSSILLLLTGVTAGAPAATTGPVRAMWRHPGGTGGWAA